VRINIGSETGLKVGMPLRLLAGPGADQVLPGITGTIAEPLGAATAAVTLNPTDTTIPADGWYGEIVVAEHGNDA
jgi:hypothetical protein